MSEEKKESGKKEKTFPLKKLPSLMRKKYARKSLGKLLGKVYIEDDRKFVEAFFTDTVAKGKKELLRIPPETEFRKAEFERLKSIAKDIKKNKMRVKLVPLVACASLVAAVTITVGAFKNVIARKAIKSGCEAVFGAKTDVGSVRVRLLGISVRVDSLAIGDKDSENFMKNLFEAENITLDMNFTQALRGKAIINDVSVSGMKFGTDRKTSCELPKRRKGGEAGRGKRVREGGQGADGAGDFRPQIAGDGNARRGERGGNRGEHPVEAQDAGCREKSAG